MKKRLLSFALTICMVLAMIPAMPAYATPTGPTVGTGGAYSTLAEALAVANNGDTITLLSDVTEAENTSANSNAFNTTGKTVTIDGGGHTITAPTIYSVSYDVLSYPLKLTGDGTVILKDITLKGGGVSQYNQRSAGLWTNLDAGGLVISEGTVNVIGGDFEELNIFFQSYGLYNTGNGTVNIKNASGGAIKAGETAGVRQSGSGTVNVHTATGGNSTNGDSTTICAGTYSSESTGVINVTNAVGGSFISGANYCKSVGVAVAFGSRVNVTNAEAKDAPAGGISSGVYASSNPGNTHIVNVSTAAFGTGNAYSARVYNGVGIVNIGGDSTANIRDEGTTTTDATDTLTLEANGGSCVLSEITVAKNGSTTVGTLPAVYKNGIAGKWYTDSALTTLFSGTTVSGGGTLYAGWVQSMPTFSPAAGAVIPGTTVAISSAGAEHIYYTTDGTDPATSVTGSTSEYTGPLTIDAAKTIKAIAVRAGADNSTIAAAAYTLDTTGAKTITAFTFNGLTPNVTGTINEAAKTIALTVPYGTDVTALVPTITHTGASISPNTGTPQNFTAPATYTVTALNSSTATYTVTVTVASGGGGGGGGSSTPTTVTKIESGGNVTATNVDNLVKEGKKLTVEGKAGEKLVLDTEALKNIDGQTKDNIKVEIKDVSTNYKNEHPDRLVVSLTITAGGKHITNFGKGTATVSLPYELKEGEKAADVTVWYLAEDGTMTEVACTYDATTKLATFKVNHFSLYVVGTADTSKWTNPFSDVKESSWFYDAVRYVSANGLMNGTTETAFNSGAKTTRGMIVTILWRMENEPKASKDMTFTDVKNGKYYHDAVAWASEKGIVGGYSAEQFGPEDNITREQLAVILHNYAAVKGYNTVASADPSASLSAFGDAGKIHSWSRDAMSWANAEGLINGTDNNLLDPLGAAQRSQVAAILQRFIESTAK